MQIFGVQMKVKPRFCISCASPLNFGVIAPDELPRYHCTACGYIHYESPRVLVTALMTWKDQLLLMRRAENPGRGGWAVPGGFMELGECPSQAAARELKEETGVEIEPNRLLLFAIGYIGPTHEIYLTYRGELTTPDCSPGVEALELGFFREQDVPWTDMAFRVPKDSLEAFFHDHRSR